MARKKVRIYSADFETTVYEGQTATEVWASAVVELYTEDVRIFHSLDETLDWALAQEDNVMLYYHNLKFDGSFWLDFLLNKRKYRQAYDILSEEPFACKWRDEKNMPNHSIKYAISNKGAWYSITIKDGHHYIYIRDSLKLLPFSVRRIGESFGTKHKKLDMEYTGYRYAGCPITDEEKHYIANDVLVVKEALEIMFDEGHKKMTIGSCCLSEFRKDFNTREYDMLFPDLYTMDIDPCYDYPTAGDYILKSYKGGWCYLARGKEARIKTNGCTLDVNSLYPSMMHSCSGNRYPIGDPTFWTGNYIPEMVVNNPDYYYFVRVRTRFYLKPGKLPFIQIKGNWLYKGNDMLETSDLISDGRSYTHYIGTDGEEHSTAVTLTLTCTDFKLFKEHYDLVDFEILDGCYFATDIGIFDHYIDHYRVIKQNSKGAQRELAKLFLNNLYGKMAATTDSSFKVAFTKQDGTLAFVEVEEHDKKPGYIAIGSAITSYARNFTIRAAQANYYGPDRPGFCYADTDSIHCDIAPECIRGVTVDDKAFCCWKPESCWDKAIFTRQKTYIEHVVQENLEPCEPYYNIKCAGMPDKCKDLLVKNIEGYKPQEGDGLTAEEVAFLAIPFDLTKFTVGLRVPGKLMPKRIPGGIVLKEGYYEMRFN